MERLVIDIFGTGLGFFATLLFYDAFWARKRVKKHILVGGFALIFIVDIIFTTFLINTAALTMATATSKFVLSFFFISGISYKVLISVIITTLHFISEALVGVIIVQILGISAEQILDTAWMYFIGVLASKLFTILIVCLSKIYLKNKNEKLGRRFNLLMGFVAIMPLMISFIVVGYIADIYILRTPIFGIITVTFSLILVFVIMYILSNQLKIMENEKQIEMARAKLEAQVKHYQQLQQKQSEVRAIRHDLRNSLTAVSGVLRDGNIDGALDFIEKITADVVRTAENIYTGLPTIDAVLNTKVARANKHGLRIVYMVNIENEVHINQIELGIIVATALDNAIEGVLRSGDGDKTVILDITDAADYISIYVENPASAPVNKSFETSKADKANHGFGMRQMENITKKYNGTVQPEYNQEAGKFYLRILMENKSE
ncbi:MAG: GHKL domain-containing protein [Oscillospiraceae bacterium]|nr:GHKL domain-containing protein [Oscillospiraceae bacterium]MCL2278235.1 GHKL domain-containing protein [Oscillospiraceae bacterium]